MMQMYVIPVTIGYIETRVIPTSRIGYEVTPCQRAAKVAGDLSVRCLRYLGTSRPLCSQRLLCSQLRYQRREVRLGGNGTNYDKAPVMLQSKTRRIRELKDERVNIQW